MVPAIRCASVCQRVFSRTDSLSKVGLTRNFGALVGGTGYANYRRCTRGNLLANFASIFSQSRTNASMPASEVVTTEGLEVFRIPCLSDNYSWLLREPVSGMTAVVDPAELRPVLDALDERGFALNYILNTHHHFDHVGANMDLKKKYGCTIVGPKADESRIPGIDIALQDGESWKFGELDMVVFDTPGHTRGHITLFFPQALALFPGDTLFAMGCGRLFEGHPAQMWASLSKLTPLPPDTKVFCAHEYTQKNGQFALSVDPSNPDLIKRMELVKDMRSKGIPTIPSTIGDELKTNPFLRPGDAALKAGVGLTEGATEVDVFAALRKAKDHF